MQVPEPQMKDRGVAIIHRLAVLGRSVRREENLMERGSIAWGRKRLPAGGRARVATSLVATSVLVVGLLAAAAGTAGAAGRPTGGSVAHQAKAKAHRAAKPDVTPSAALALLHSFTLNGGYVADGVGMRNLGSGTIHLSGIPTHAVVYKAFLYWDVLNTESTTATERGTFDGSPIRGNAVGEGTSPCWSAANNFSYVANVTRFVNGNGTYGLSNFASGLTTGATAEFDAVNPLLEGATLVVVYEDAVSAPTTVQLYGGATMTKAGTKLSSSFTGFTAGSTHVAKTTFIVADGQTYTTTTVATGGGIFNGSLEIATFTGHTHMTNTNTARYDEGNLWDTDTVTATSLVAPGSTSASASVTGGDDCLVWVGQAQKLFVLSLQFLFVIIVFKSTYAASQQVLPGEVWRDNRGQQIQAHGGGILHWKGRYYWVGEDRTQSNDPEKRYVACYASKDLVHWTFRGQILALADPEHLGPNWVLERPKLFHNPRTGRFVLYFHLDDSRYKLARVGVAVSDRIDGTYSYVKSFRPLDQESRDIGHFIDDDGSAYLIFESRPTNGFFIAKMSDDYMTVEKQMSSASALRSRAAHWSITTAFIMWWVPI